MNIKWFDYFSGCALLIPLFFLPAPRSHPAPVPQPPAVAPAPASGGKIQINELLFYPPADGYEWVELKNPYTTPTVINNYRLTDQDGNNYFIPQELPPVPGKGLVLVIFDGKGEAFNDYDFSDQLAVLHTPPGLVDIFEETEDQCALYRSVFRAMLPMVLKNLGTSPPATYRPRPQAPHSSRIADFVAWGAMPYEAAGEAADEDIWEKDMYVSLQRGGFYRENYMPPPAQTIGVLPGAVDRYTDRWYLYQSREGTPGEENPYPTVIWVFPWEDGMMMDPLMLGWAPMSGARSHRLQIDDSPDFTSPITDTWLHSSGFTMDLPEGLYHCRIKTRYSSGESEWSAPIKVKVMDFDVDPNTHRSPQVPADHPLLSPTLPLSNTSALPLWRPSPRPQRKDTLMLCTGGCPDHGPFAWDIPHPEDFTHARGYCARHALSLLVGFYGGNLSQDRLSYEMFRRIPGTLNTLGHGVGISPTIFYDVMRWALNAPVSITYELPTFGEFHQLIDSESPMIAVITATETDHTVLIKNYGLDLIAPDVFTELMYVVNPGHGEGWAPFSSIDRVQYYFTGPPGHLSAPDARWDEDDNDNGVPDTMEDTDHDGICDFDELHRFGTDPNDTDTDDDGLPDKTDMRERVFDNLGSFKGRNPDVDGDGRSKEQDPDNDDPLDRSAWDSGEDANHNGKYEPEFDETDNFAPWDDRTPWVTITYPPTDHDNGYDCIIEVKGMVETDTPLVTALEVKVLDSSGRETVQRLSPQGAPPYYTFRTEIALFAGWQKILVIATNQYGAGRTYTTVLATCEKMDRP